LRSASKRNEYNPTQGGKKKRYSWGMAQMVEYLASEYGTLSSNSSTVEKKKSSSRDAIKGLIRKIFYSHLRPF
jgi:hypothetical protein